MNGLSDGSEKILSIPIDRTQNDRIHFPSRKLLSSICKTFP